MNRLSKDDVRHISCGSLELLVLENGYFNASKICRAHNKDFSDWAITGAAKIAIDEAARHSNLSADQIVMQITKTSNNLKGTYLHPVLLIHIATWCDVKYTIELSSVVWKGCEIDACAVSSKNFIVDNKKRTDTKVGLYLIRIGSVETLRQQLDIPNKYPDYSDVHKFGKSTNINRRQKNHTKNFGTVTELVYCVNIPQRLLSKAELRLSDMFSSLNIKFTHQNHRELIIITQSVLTLVKCVYDSIELEFACE